VKRADVGFLLLALIALSLGSALGLLLWRWG